MPLPTLTRNQAARDDIFTPSTYVIDAGVTLTSNGDIGSLSGTDATHGAEQAALSINTTTFPLLMVRAAAANGGNLDCRITYADATTQTFTLALSSNYATPVNTLTAGKTINKIKFLNQTVAGTITLDFWLVFKELLTFPTVLTPISYVKRRNVVELLILGREGGILQDMGSMSPEITYTGNLITTTTPNNYTADQWWQILIGVMIESGTVQADGNPTWQWFTADETQAKMIMMVFQPRQPMGRFQYWDYSIMFKQFDVLGETVASLPGISY